MNLRRLALLLWLVPALFASFPPLSNAQGVLVLGDSISAGLGVPAGAGWVELLRTRLAADPSPTAVVNASISGETSEGGKSRLPTLLEQYRPSLVLIELGGNDGLRGFPIAVTRANMLAMIDAALAAEARVLLLGMRIPPNYGTRYTEAFHRLYQDVAQERGVALVPFLLEGIATRPELMQDDGIHPRAEAQALILENVLPALTDLDKD